MRFNFRFLVAALMTIGSSYAIAQVDVIDRFDGTTLNSRWITAPGLFTKAGGSYRQTNGALNFTVATGSTSRVENNIHVLNTNSLPTDQSWTLVIGMHNSADYSPSYGSSQLQMGVLDLRTINSDFRGVVFTLARYRDLNGGNPLFGFYGTNLPKWHENGGIWTNANTNASARFEYNALTRTLQGFVTTDGVNPIDNTYNYFPAGPASSIPIPATAKLNLLVIQNVYSVAVPVGKMWVDNYKLSFAPLDGRLYPGLPATLSRRPGQDLFLSVSPRDEGTFTYDWRKDGQAITPLSFGKQTYFKSDLKSSHSGTYSVVVKRNGTVYATNQTILTVTNTAPGAFGSDDFTNNSNRWSGLWGFDAHDSYLEVNGGRLDYVLDKAGSENSQAFQLWDNRLPSSQNWEVVIDTFMDSELSPERYFALRLGVAAPVNLANGLGALNGLEINFANSRYGGGKKIQNIKTIPTGDGWLELSQPALNQSTTAVALRMKWDAVTKVLTSYYDSNGATGGYVWTQSATNNLSSLPSSQLAAGFYALVSGIAEPSFLLPAGQAYFKNFQVRTGPVILAQMVPQTAAEGGSVTFTAPGEGTGPISYQWRKNGVAIDGQTNSTLTLSGLTASDAGQYSVFISNALGTITSSNTLLTVIVPPGFPIQATNGLRGNLGSAFRYQPMITGSAAVFTSGNLPPGLSVNRTNGLITGTPTTAGYYRSALTASNFAGTAALRLNFTIPGSPQTLPFTDDFSRTNANRYMPLGFSGISAEARAGLTNGVLRFTCISNAQAAELFPRPFGYGEEAAFGWAANLGLSVNRPWQIEADACVPESGLFGLAIYPDSLNSTAEQALPRRLNLYWHRTPNNSRGWLATSGWTVNGAGQQEEYDSPPMGYLNSGPTSSVVKLRLVMGISGTNRLLTAWGTEDLTGRGGWSQIGQTLELNPGGTTDRSHYPLGQDWNLSTNSTFSLGLFGQFGAAGQASWVDNLRVTVAVAPVITSITNLIGQVGKASFSYSISATNSPTSFAASNLPAGLGVDSSTGLITGTPTAAGSNNVVLYASSPAGTGSRTNLAIILPEFISATTSTGFVNDGGFSHRVAVGTNNFGSNLKYVASGLPTGMSINATSGLISGKPTVAGAFPATVTITALGASASQRIDFTIQGAAGGVFSLTLNPRPTNVLNLPVGLSYNKTTGVISGTPQGWGNFTATGLFSIGSPTAINIPVMPSVPLIGGPTNWNGQVGQEIEYHIVAGGYGREWAGWDDFSSGTTKWRKTPADMENLDLWPTVNSLAVANGELNYQCKRNDRAYWTYLLWNQDLPLYANWAALAKIKASGAVTQGGPGSSVRAGFRLAKIEKPASNYIEGILNQTGGLNSAVSYSPKSPSFSSSYPRSAGEEAFLAFYHNASGRTFSYHASIPTLGSELQELETYLDSSLGLGSANVIRLGIGGLAEGSLVTSGQITFDDFVLLPDPDDIEYRAYLVNSAGVALTNGQGERYLPDGLECDPQTGSVSGTVSSGVVAGTYQIRTEAEYLTANLPIQGLPSVKGGKTVPLTLLPAFTGASSATGFLNVAGFTHQVDVGAHSFGSSLKFSATGLPTGTIINATSGLISGKPTAAGTFGTRVTITAGTATAFQDIQISVYNGEGNRWAVGSPVSYQVNLGTGVTGYQASGLPTGMTINATTGLISGTPIEAGEYSVTVTVPARGLSTVVPFFIRPIYVNLAARGADNGTTWANAYTNLQTAINAAGAGSQIWVAAGTYRPTSYQDPKVTNDVRSRSFLLKGGVSVLGGFAGTEAQLAQRDVESNPTILSGDFGGNDSATWPPVVGNDGNVGSGDFTRSENAYHVVGALSQTTAPILDGFTITGGNANNVTYRQPNNGSAIPAGTVIHGWAPGIAVVNADVVIRNCHVTKNVGKGGSCAFINITGQLRRTRIADSVFEQNLAYYGNGAAFEAQVVSSQNVVSRPLLQVTVVRSAFLQNESRTGPDQDNDLYPDGGDGGAVYFYWGVEGNFVNCIFIENYANGLKTNGDPWLDGSSGGREGNGGAIQARRYCDLNIANSIFARNLCDDNGAAINMGSGVRLKMYFSTFYGNDSTNNGRGFGAGVVAGWYGPDSLRPNTMTGCGIVSWQNLPIEEEIDLWQGNYGPPPNYSSPPLPAPSTLSQSVFSTDTSLMNNIGTLRNGNPNFIAANSISGTDGLYLTADDGLRIRSGSIAQNFVGARPADFADLDEDGNTIELLPYDAVGVPFAPNPPYNAGAYQTVAP